MAEKPRTDTEGILLTRREIRRYFRVNERTIDRWMDRGLLMQVGEIPAEPDTPPKPVFLVRDDKLIQKVLARLETIDQVALDIDHLPATAREELTQNAAEETEQEHGHGEEEPGPEPKINATPKVNVTPKVRAKAKVRVKTKIGPKVKAEPASAPPAAEEAKPEAAKPQKKRTWTITRSSTPPAYQVRRKEKKTGVEDPFADERRRFAALQAAAEASASPELAEALWDDETLGDLFHAAETLSAEAVRLSQAQQAERELETAGIDLEAEEDRGPQVIDEEQALETLSVHGGDDAAKERLLLQAELAEVKSMQQANLERMEARLVNIENLVEELGLGRAHELNIESTLEEIRGQLGVTESRRDSLATSMSTITDSVQDLRAYIAAANKTALATARGVQQLSKKMVATSTGSVVSPSQTKGSRKVAPVLVLGVGILVLTWTLALYLKTGNFYVALAGVILANLSACATILLGREKDESV